MKQIVKALLIVLMALPCAVYARQLKPEVLKAMHNGAKAEIRLKVLDDRGVPVTNASVSVVFDMLPKYVALPVNRTIALADPETISQPMKPILLRSVTLSLSS